MPVKNTLPAAVNEMDFMSERISALVNLTESGDPLISAYFDLCQSKEHLQSKFSHWAIAARVTLNRTERAAFDDAHRDVVNAISEEWPEETRGLAVFSRRGNSQVHMVIPFGALLDTHFDVSSMPSIFPLVQLKDRFNRFVVAIATEDVSRIFEVTLGAVSEAILARRPELGGQLGREWGREHFHQKKRENDLKFHRDQVTIITNLMAKRGHNHLILAGNSKHVAGLREALPKSISAQLVGELHKTPSGGDYSAVLEQAIDTFIEVERSESRDTVQRLHEQVRREALAVVGVDASRDAIIGGYAAELVISEELPAAKREELTHLATARNLAIEVCEGDELLATHGGVGCLLRYRPAFIPSNMES
ncbi:MAG: hypothetical protein HC845_05710 [Akkermansiaceae bacterium]|nr:hypothetical protein [Akkermansiaceae bacterium]